MVDKAPFAPRGHVVGQGWPSFWTGPNGERQIFKAPEDVPEGWHDGSGKSTAPVPKQEPDSHTKLPVAAEGYEYVLVTHEVAAAIAGGSFKIVTHDPPVDDLAPLAPAKLTKIGKANKRPPVAESISRPNEGATA